MKKRILSILLCLVLLFGVVPKWSAPVHAATTSQNNIVDRANYLYNATWVCQKNVNGWCNNYTFYAGQTYHIPYGQPVTAGAYVGFGVSVDDYLAVAANANSVFYNSRSYYSGYTSYSTYYATDCSAFVSWCWGVSRKTTATIPGISTNLGYANSSNVYNLQLGDALNSNSVGHVVLVTGLAYSNGTLTQIEITEQTPPQLKRSYYTPASLASKYGSYYTIQRYTGNVPESPGGSTRGVDIPDSLKDWVFDPFYYAERYSDLKDSYGYDEAKLYDHFKKTGLKEGRQASAAFSIAYYVSSSDDLVKAFGTDYVSAFSHFVSAGRYEASRSYSEELNAVKDWIFEPHYYADRYSDLKDQYDYDAGQLFNHFISAGIREGRRASSCFDIQYYISQGEDLTKIFSANTWGAFQHFLRHGRHETTRSYSAELTEAQDWIFDAHYYADRYTDARDVFGYDRAKLLEHFLTSGINEGRVASPSFDVSYYLNANSDLANAFNGNNRLAFEHFMKSGRYEGHRFFSEELTKVKPLIFDAKFYSQSYDDLNAQYGTDADDLFAHFMRHGIKDGRCASPFFDIAYYLEQNSDIKSNFGTDTKGAFIHFLNGGQYEKRAVSPILNVRYYTAKYTDLANLNTIEAMKHFKNSGIGSSYRGSAEFDPIYYYATNADLPELGYNQTNCYLHYLLCGISEGRLGAGDVAPADLGDTLIVTIGNVGSGKNLTADETENVIIYQSSDSDAQKWHLVRQSDGSYEITNLEYNKCLDVKGARPIGGTNILIYADNDSAAQRWYIYRSGEAYIIKPGCCVDCVMDVQGGAQDNGTNVQTANYNGTEAQLWVIKNASHTHVGTAQSTVAPTCSEQGYTLYSCTLCGEDYKADFVSTTEHTPVTDAAVASGCETTGLTEGSHCEVCGKVLVAQEVVPADGHQYEKGACTVCGAADPDYVRVTVPTITFGAPTLNFEDIIYYNFYYTVSDMTDVEEMGLLILNSRDANADITTAAKVLPGYTQVGSRYMVHTEGIPAMNLGDTVYVKVYAKLSDGSYAYSGVGGYNAVAYANDILANSTNAKMKSLVVAMLNYGAAAQTYFGYNTDNLMNAGLTAEQQALVENYSAGMVEATGTVDSSKIGSFGKVSGGFTALTPSMVFEGALAVNFYLGTKATPSNGVTLYYWDLATYNSAQTLTAENATGVVEAELVNGRYLASVEGIAAKQIDETFYIAAVCQINGTSYCTGVIPYTLATYCLDRIANGTTNMRLLAQATVVYGSYAKNYFA